MTRIRAAQSNGELVIQVEGELTAPAVAELESCWRTAGDITATEVVVNIGAVSTIDNAGRSLLRTMHSKGVTFEGASLAIQDVIEEITGPAPGGSGR